MFLRKSQLKAFVKCVFESDFCAVGLMADTDTMNWGTELFVSIYFGFYVNSPSYL